MELVVDLAEATGASLASDSRPPPTLTFTGSLGGHGVPRAAEFPGRRDRRERCSVSCSRSTTGPSWSWARNWASRPTSRRSPTRWFTASATLPIMLAYGRALRSRVGVLRQRPELPPDSHVDRNRSAPTSYRSGRTASGGSGGTSVPADHDVADSPCGAQAGPEVRASAAAHFGYRPALDALDDTRWKPRRAHRQLRLVELIWPLPPLAGVPGRVMGGGCGSRRAWPMLSAMSAATASAE